MYLEGAIEFLQERNTLDIVGLCCGKISLEDIKRPKIYNNLRKEKNLVPLFMENWDSYMKALDIIAETNHIELNTDNKELGQLGQGQQPPNMTIEERK